MIGNGADPVDSRVLQRDRRVQTFGHGMGDQGGPLFGEEVDQLPLRFDQGVDQMRLPIEKVSDLVLSME